MSNFNPQAMDKAADDASIELETIREEYPEGVKAIEDWTKKWTASGGYRRLGKIIADRWD